MFVRSQSSKNQADALTIAAPRLLPAGAVRLASLTIKMHLAEFVLVSAAAYVSGMLYQYTALDSQLEPKHYAPAALYIGALVSAISAAFRHFLSIRREPLHVLLWNGIGAVALAFSFFLSTLFLLKFTGVYSRGAFVFQLIGVSATVCATRTMFYFWLQSAIRAGHVEARRVVLIGDEQYWPQFGDMVRTNAIRSVAFLPFPPYQNPNTHDCEVLVDRKAVRQAIDLCRSAAPDDIVILASQEELAAAPELARLLSELPVSVHIVPLGSVNIFGTSHIAELGDLKTLVVSRPPLSAFDLAVKRAFDIIVAAIGLFLLAPLFAAVAIAIKLESGGDVFFRQKRHGYNNTIIHVIKFRSMTPAPEGDCFVQATRKDARVTQVGRFLRRTNIDELPQLFNVLAGDMSIVGPRPHATAHNQMFEGKILPFSRRHNIKPGITGWAQVNGHRGETDTLEKMQRRVEHDLFYIDNWSFLLDLKIILLTLFSKRAYVNAY